MEVPDTLYLDDSGSHRTVHASCNDNPVCETAKETQMYRTVLGLCGRGRRGMIWENGIKTCIISYKKRIASPGLMQDTGCLGLVHWDDPEGWYREGGGRGVRIRNTCISVANSC